MAKIMCREQFTLKMGGVATHFTVGLHEVPDEVARHPYVKMWSDVLASEGKTDDCVAKSVNPVPENAKEPEPEKVDKVDAVEVETEAEEDAEVETDAAEDQPKSKAKSQKAKK